MSHMPTNDAYLDAPTDRGGDTLSAGSTARQESYTRAMENGNNHNNSLEKDFSRQNGGGKTPMDCELYAASPNNKQAMEVMTTSIFMLV